MRNTIGRPEAELVAAAQAGDRYALDDLVATYLPMIYTLVRRGLDDQKEVDDVVQDTMVRAIRDLRSLRTPESFRPWLVSIALRQVATQRSRDRSSHERTAPLDEATVDLIAGGDVQDAAVARLELTHQRRQLVRAGQWLDGDDRAVLSLWWLETAGSLSRAEVAEALGVSVAHAGVRVQRMRDQLSVCRAIVTALDNRPRCPEFEAIVAVWDGLPSSVWRKRLSRHLRSCPICGAEDGALVAPEKLLIPFALLPVPFALGAGLAGMVTLAAKAAAGGAAATSATAAGGIAGSAGVVGTGAKLGALTQLAAAHPLITTVAAALVVGGTAVTASNLPSVPPRERPVAAANVTPTPSSLPAMAPTPATPATPATHPTMSAATTTHDASATSIPAPPMTLALGPVSLAAAFGRVEFVRADEDLAFMSDNRALAGDPARQQATFEIVRGLADEDCYSFRSPDGRYLRHASYRFRLMRYEDWDLYREDATFCVRQGAVAGSIRLESLNYRGWFVHQRGNELWIARSDGSGRFKAESSFRVHAPLAP